MQPPVHIGRKLDPALDRERPHQLQCVDERVAAVDRRQGQGLPARLDPRDVEHLVDQLEQVVAGAQDALHAGARLGIEPLELEQLPEPEDRVERGAQLVAHAREELALGVVRPLSLLARLAGRGLGALAVGDVGRDAAERVGPPVRVEERELDREPAAVLDAGRGLLDLEGAHRPHHLAVMGLVDRRGGEREHVAVGVADDVLAAQAEAALEMVVDEHVAALGVLDVDQRRRVVHDVLELPDRLGQGADLARALRHVVDRDHEAAVAWQRHHADLDRALAHARGDRAAARLGELGPRPPPVASDDVVDQPAHAVVPGQRREARIRKLDAQPSVVEADDRRRHGAVLEREAAQVAGHWGHRRDRLTPARRSRSHLPDSRSVDCAPCGSPPMFTRRPRGEGL